MCGRTVCTLDPAAICKSCAYKDRSGNVVQPGWRDAPTGDVYLPSYNIPPTAFTPVLVSARALAEACPQRAADSGRDAVSAAAAATTERVVQPMRWGMVPPWHSGPDAKSFPLLLSNCRSDSMKTKRSFVAPLRKGRRCVVLAEGFYEWKQTTKPKQPYFIRYRPGSCGSESREGCKYDPLSIKKENASVGPGHLDGELMKMAGIFDVWMDQNTGEPLYSYCVITVDGSSTIGDIHDRMPAVLQNDDEVTRWLDSQTHPLDEAVRLVRPVERVDCYAVSTFVSNVRNNSPECIAPLVERKPPTSSPTGIMKWFVKTSDGERKVGGGVAEAASACVEQGSAAPPPPAHGIKRRCDATTAAVENETVVAGHARTPGKTGDG